MECGDVHDELQVLAVTGGSSVGGQTKNKEGAGQQVLVYRQWRL